MAILKQGGVRAVVFLVALYGAVFTLAQSPPPHRFALLAQASVPGELKQQCLKGYEYWVGISRYGQDEIVITKKPPANAKEESLPPGVVRYNDGRGGYVSLTCKEGTSVRDTIPLGTVLHPGSLDPATLPTAKSMLGNNGVYSNPAAGTIAPPDSSLLSGGAMENVPYRNPAPTEGVQLSSDFTPTNEPPSVKAIDEQIQTDAQANIENDPTLRDNAFQMRLCQQQGTCDVGTLESNNSLSTEQQLRSQSQQAVQKDYASAIQNAYGPDYQVNAIGDASVARVSQSDWGARYYDTDTGQSFLGKAAWEAGPTIITSEGQGFSTDAPASQWQSAMQETIDSPTKFNTLEAEYMDHGATPNAYMLTTNGTEVITHGACPTCDKIVPLDGYDAVRAQGDSVYGVDAIKSQVADLTGGKVNFDSPSSFPEQNNVSVYRMPDALTQLPIAERAAAISIVEQELEKYPPTYWQNANPVTVYTYGYTPEAIAQTASAGQFVGGWADRYSQQVWLNGTEVNPANGLGGTQNLAATIDHELTHYNDAQLFGSDAQYAYGVYGPQYGTAYAGQSGWEAQLSGKFERPEGFARDYGYLRGIKEDQATVVESMFANYPAVEQAMQTDGTLAAKVDLAKQGFYNMSTGVMNDAYWQNLKPINPNYALPPMIASPAPSLIQIILSNPFVGL